MIPSTGEKIQNDTSLVTIPIKYIKLANVKLLERNYLLEINEVKDSIINDYEKCIKEYERIDKEYTAKLELSHSINKDLHKSLERQKKTSLVLGSVAGASVLTIILIALVN